MNLQRIKKLTKSDITKSFVTQFNEIYETSWERSPMQSFMTNDNTYLHANIEKDKLKGFCYGYYLPSFGKSKGTAFLWAIAINEKYRNKGIGTALIEFGKLEALKLSCSNMFLVTQTDNPKAISLYKRLGGRIGHSGEDRLIWFDLKNTEVKLVNN